MLLFFENSMPVGGLIFCFSVLCVLLVLSISNVRLPHLIVCPFLLLCLFCCDVTLLRKFSISWWFDFLFFSVVCVVGVVDLQFMTAIFYCLSIFVVVSVLL